MKIGAPGAVSLKLDMTAPRMILVEVTRGTVDVADLAATSRQAAIERKAPGHAARNWAPDRIRRYPAGERVELSLADARELAERGIVRILS